MSGASTSRRTATSRRVPVVQLLAQRRRACNLSTLAPPFSKAVCASQGRDAGLLLQRRVACHDVAPNCTTCLAGEAGVRARPGTLIQASTRHRVATTERMPQFSRTSRWRSVCAGWHGCGKAEIVSFPDWNVNERIPIGSCFLSRAQHSRAWAMPLVHLNLKTNFYNITRF